MSVPRPAAAVLLASLALSGCFGASDEDKVRESIRGFSEAVRTKDYEAICSRYVSNRLKEQMRLVNECPTFLKRTYSGPAIDPKFTMEITSIELDDASGVVKLNVRTRDREASGEVRVARDGEHWGLATLP